MGPRLPTHPQTTGLLVCFWDDHIVRRPMLDILHIESSPFNFKRCNSLVYGPRGQSGC